MSLTPAQVAVARKAVADHTHDLDEEFKILDMLGLM